MHIVELSISNHPNNFTTSSIILLKPFWPVVFSQLPQYKKDAISYQQDIYKFYSVPLPDYKNRFSMNTTDRVR
jgi:hypothetical protein